MKLAAFVLALALGTAAADEIAIDSVVAVVPEGFWRFSFSTEEGVETWSIFVAPDTTMTEDAIEVSRLDSTAVLIYFEPALVCTAYEFVDPPLPQRWSSE